MTMPGAASAARPRSYRPVSRPPAWSRARTEHRRLGPRRLRRSAWRLGSPRAPLRWHLPGRTPAVPQGGSWRARHEMPTTLANRVAVRRSQAHPPSHRQLHGDGAGVQGRQAQKKHAAPEDRPKDRAFIPHHQAIHASRWRQRSFRESLPMNVPVVGFQDPVNGGIAHPHGAVGGVGGGHMVLPVDAEPSVSAGRGRGATVARGGTSDPPDTIR